MQLAKAHPSGFRKEEQCIALLKCHDATNRLPVKDGSPVGRRSFGNSATNPVCWLGTVGAPWENLS